MSQHAPKGWRTPSEGDVSGAFAVLSIALRTTRDATLHRRLGSAGVISRWHCATSCATMAATPRSGPFAAKPPSAEIAAVTVIENHDSFTHNMVHALAMAGARCVVVADGRCSVDEVLAHTHDGIVVSAGPCTPQQSRTSLALVERLLADDCPPPLLGICLGHQCLATALGGSLKRSVQPLHGRTCHVRHTGHGVLSELEQPFVAARYNSLTVDAASLGPTAVPTAWDENGELMGLCHSKLPLQSVQFHPESHLSRGGQRLFDAWVKMLAQRRRSQ